MTTPATPTPESPPASGSPTAAGPGRLDVAAIRRDFPVLGLRQNGHRLVFLDSAASSQHPRQVLDAMTSFYETSYANVHRGVYQLAERATAGYEGARSKVARFIGAPSTNEVVFTKNATEAINLVAGSWGRANLGPGDAVVLTLMEHHANIVPWQMLAAHVGFEIRWVPLTEDGHLDLTDLDRLLDGAKLFAFTAMSNVLGTLNPVARLTAAAHDKGALALVDACQWVPHLVTDVVAMGADFVAFSAHKMLGPSGIGVLWARSELLEAMPPFLGGGGMILNVTTEGFTPDAPPGRFEAGTPPIAEAVGLAAAIDYLTGLGMDAVHRHEVELTGYALRTLKAEVGDALTIYGPSEPSERGGVLSIALEGVHAHDISQVLDTQAVCIRPGHHCAKPLMRVLGAPATARASIYVYNDTDDIDALAAALVAARDFFKL
ncbi:MAG: SufS family cysteine desulfurase [Acidimicrobiia bacterium]|nr:SufS family cysteine desulfurase [Acidimicrobiia bacterium]MDH4363266.1 SufS family cysteine desulfurase [Acidimicrobiia bacterium]